MLLQDVYKSIKERSEAVYREKGSKFIALAFPVETEMQVKKTLAEIKKEYHDARHYCYAYILGAEKVCYKMNDDGEPVNSAGKPIYGQLRAKDLTNILLVTVRYFGGTKLGVGGLMNAYKTAAQEVLNNSEIVEKTIEEYYQIQFQYEEMNRVMALLRSDSITILTSPCLRDNLYVIDFKIRKREEDLCLEQLKKIKFLKYSRR